MFGSKIIRGVLLPSAALLAEDKLNQQGVDDGPKCRRSELPIYVPEPAAYPQEPEPAVPNFIEDSISTARQQITLIYSEMKAYQKVGLDYIEQSKENAECWLKYLREEDNTTPKAGAIAIGGLTGLIFGLRGGFFKRTIYATSGALGMAALCYPKEASEYSQMGITETKKYATIAYNFVYGGKEQETQEQVISNNEEQTDVTEIDALTIVTKVHDSSETCDCSDISFDHQKPENTTEN